MNSTNFITLGDKGLDDGTRRGVQENRRIGDVWVALEQISAAASRALESLLLQHRAAMLGVGRWWASGRFTLAVLDSHGSLLCWTLWALGCRRREH
ncbi:hypothetical protein CISIN_1g039094mg [Citrus sinensis]|uniref:Uncharacterized protein n=1 Tax=Citrus sinensis TaxID=2711 RepID=A0A067D470_CITSI|nr:hypothetical protein CISIN_1g039094mg [Citrus sinensis]